MYFKIYIYKIIISFGENNGDFSWFNKQTYILLAHNMHAIVVQVL